MIRRSVTRSWRASILSTGLLTAIGLLLACRETPCDGFSVGSRVTITVLAQQQPGPTRGPGCGPEFDLTPGQVLHAKVVGSVDDLGLCYEGIPTFLEPVGRWTWILDLATTQAEGSGTGSLYGLYNAVDSTCRGQVVFNLSPNGGGVVGPLEAGGPVPWLLTRRFQSSSTAMDAGSASCPPLFCDDSFAASVEISH